MLSYIDGFGEIMVPTNSDKHEMDNVKKGNLAEASVKAVQRVLAKRRGQREVQYLESEDQDLPNGVNISILPRAKRRQLNSVKVSQGHTTTQSPLAGASPLHAHHPSYCLSLSIYLSIPSLRHSLSGYLWR